MRDEAFNIDKNYDGYQHRLASMVYKSFDKKSSVGSATLANKFAIKTWKYFKQELAEELHKPIIRKFKRREVQSTFIDNIWGADPADMQLRCKFNKGFRFLLCVIDFSVNTHGLFLCKIKEVLQLLIVSKKV